MFGYPRGWSARDPFGAAPTRRRPADPFFGSSTADYDNDDHYFHPTQRPYVRAPAAAPRRQLRTPRYPVEADDSDMAADGSFARPYVYRDPYSRRAGGDLAARQRLLQERQAAQQRAQNLRQRQLKALHRGQERAATRIQRAWRAHLAKQRAAEQQAASFVVTRTVARVGAMRSALRVIASLRRLRSAEAKIDALKAAFEAAPRGYRHVLGYADALEKEVLKLDEVPHYGDEFVRQQRKAVVRIAQQAIRVADFVSKVMERRITVLQRRLRRWYGRHTESTRIKAARVIQRTLQAAPGRMAARRTSQELKFLHEKQQHLDALRRDYFDALTSMASEASRISATADAEAQHAKDPAVAEAAGIVAAHATWLASKAGAELRAAQQAAAAAGGAPAAEGSRSVPAAMADATEPAQKMSKADGQLVGHGGHEGREGRAAEAVSTDSTTTAKKRKKNKNKKKRGKRSEVCSTESGWSVNDRSAADDDGVVPVVAA